MQSENDSPFVRLLTRLARVPKSEVDEEQRREERNKARRTTPKPPAKPGHIVPTEPTTK
jgi:hypothetical protein